MDLDKLLLVLKELNDALAKAQTLGVQFTGTIDLPALIALVMKK